MRWRTSRAATLHFEGGSDVGVITRVLEGTRKNVILEEADEWEADRAPILGTACCRDSCAAVAGSRRERHERRRVHRGQTAGRGMTDDDCLHAVDSVRANNLGTCHHAQLIAIGTR